jgi:hypothetical protein
VANEEGQKTRRRVVTRIGRDEMDVGGILVERFPSLVDVFCLPSQLHANRTLQDVPHDRTRMTVGVGEAARGIRDLVKQHVGVLAELRGYRARKHDVVVAGAAAWAHPVADAHAAKSDTTRTCCQSREFGSTMRLL